MTRPPALPQALAALALTALVLLAAACARHAPQAPPTPADGLWQAFGQSRLAASQSGPALSARASLQYSGPKRNSRVLLKLWGDLGYPLRLDVEAGIGASIAMLREDAKGLTAYFPQSGEAMVSADARRGLWPLGLDAPLSLADLAGLVAGTYDGLAPQAYASAEPSGEGGWTYGFQGPGPLATLTLDARARPVAMTGAWADSPWEMVLSGHDGEGRTAQKMTLERPPDTRVVIRIKENERRHAPWPPEALALELPPGTRIIPPEIRPGTRP